MRKAYTKPDVKIENFLMDMDIMAGISKELLEFHRSIYEDLCKNNNMDPNDEDNWNAYKATLDVSIPYCYHTAIMFS